MPDISDDTKLVSVGCKLPNGIHLDLKRKEGERERITLNGANAARIVGGFGITNNVSAEFMTEWLRKNAKHPAVMNGSIFIHKDANSAESIAKERRAVKTGLEAIDPTKSGVMRDIDGATDNSALASYQKQKAENPDRNRQQVVE